MSPRTGTILWTVLTVAILGAVIFGVAALSSPSGSSELTPAEQSQQYYERALTQEALGNLDEAKELAEKAFAVDSTNTKAKTLIVKIETAQKQASSGGSGSSAGGGSSPGGGSPGTTPTATPPPPPPGDDSPFMKPAKDILVFVPKAIEGWVLATPVAVGPDGTVAGEPAASVTELRAVSRAVLAVHDRGTPSGATAFVDQTMKQAYPQGGTAVVVAGAPGYFGTDGTRLAAVAFARGRYAFEVVVTSSAGDPATFKDAVMKLASAFPTQL